MAITGIVGRRGQITLPVAVREWLGLKEGDRVIFTRKADEVALHPLTQTLLDLRGSVPVQGPQDFDAMRQQVIAEHARAIAEDRS